MLRAKKFLNVKKRELYKYLSLVNIDKNTSIIERKESILLDVYYISLYLNDDFECKITRDLIFSYKNSTINYTIQYEKYTDTWMLVCKDIIVLYIDNNDIENFCSTFNTSNDYKFKIYRYNLGYLAICISHFSNSNNIDILLNYAKDKYIILSHFVKQKTFKNDDEYDDEYDKKPTSFIILNDNVRNKLDNDYKNNNIYAFYTNIGLKSENITILFFIDVLMNYIKIFKNYPLNYICI